jgi:nucleolar protein 56
MSVDYLLHESSVGYAIFQVVHQPDTVGNRLREVQDSVQVFCVDREELLSEETLTFFQDLAKFGKMVKLVSFAPFQ